MNSLILLKRSRVRLASLTQQALFLLNSTHNSSSNHHFISNNCCFSTYTTNNYGFNREIKGDYAVSELKLRRDFHAGGSLEFKATSELSQIAAVEDFSDEDPKRVGSAKGDEGLEISKLGIADQIVTALAKKGITKLFPIQRAVLEPAMKGRDMIGRAKTGTGKTLAFGIPIMDKIIRIYEKQTPGRNPLALCLAPTRELASQVEKEFFESCNLDTICVYGGTPIARQRSSLERGVDIVVGTPGRVIDLINRGALILSEIQFVVLDEADQMLAVGFADAVETILKNLPLNRQTLMFSATMPKWIIEVTRKYLNNPVTIDLVGENDKKLAEGISLYSIVSEMYDRPGIIGPLVTEHAKGGKCIVFTQTKRDAHQLAFAMQKIFPCEALHGDITQVQREKTLSAFRNGQFNVLFATDVAARGLDVPNVDLVIHYELPNSSEIFVHRSGRTGRAGKKGKAVIIYSSNQVREVRGIERDVGCQFAELPRIQVEPGVRDMFRNMGGGGNRFGSFGSMGGDRFGNSSYGRSGGYGGYGSSNSGSYGGSSYGRSGGYGSGNFGGYGGSSSSRSGGFGGSSGRSSSGFGGQSSGTGGYGGPSGQSGRSGSFGDSGSGSQRSGGYGNFGSGYQRSGGYGNMGGSDRSSGYGDFGSGRSSNSTRSSGFGFGNDKVDDSIF